MDSTFKAVNWNASNVELTKVFWDQNIRQFWVDTEIPISGDKLIWQTKIKPEEKELYTKVLASLTLLDTHQGAIGMNKICSYIEDLPTKGVIQFIGMMEQMHAKSYSAIFSTLLSSSEINELFKWVEEESLVQNKLKLIVPYYESIKDMESLYLAMAASVFLESFLFYSGFFYPLYLAGQSLLVNSGEIINLIIRDESVHGLYIGSLASTLLKTFSKETQLYLTAKTFALLDKLMANEIQYTEKLYSKVGLTEEVLKFIKYNANKALQNLNLPDYYDVTEEDFNPLVLNGLNTSTKQHDFFSSKGNGYIKTTNTEELTDEDFILD